MCRFILNVGTSGSLSGSTSFCSHFALRRFHFVLFVGQFVSKRLALLIQLVHGSGVDADEFAGYVLVMRVRTAFALSEMAAARV